MPDLASLTGKPLAPHHPGLRMGWSGGTSKCGPQDCSGHTPTSPTAQGQFHTPRQAHEASPTGGYHHGHAMAAGQLAPFSRLMEPLHSEAPALLTAWLGTRPAWSFPDLSRLCAGTPGALCVPCLSASSPTPATATPGTPETSCSHLPEGAPSPRHKPTEAPTAQQQPTHPHLAPRPSALTPGPCLAHSWGSGWGEGMCGDCSRAQLWGGRMKPEPRRRGLSGRTFWTW